MVTDPTDLGQPTQGADATLVQMDNLYSLDGDDLINDFYATAENINLRDALISNGLIRPASTMVFLNGENLRIVNTTLDGLAEQTLGLGNDQNSGIARFNNINLINCSAGEIDIHNAIVDGLTVGGQATINLHAGQLNNFRITEDSNVILRTEGGTLNRVHFDGANFDERSSFANAVIRGSEILNCNFDHVDFTRADISEVHIGGGNISGNFTGAMLRNMSIAADIRDMQVTDSTTFHNVQVFDPTLQQYRRVDNIDQFNAIKRSYDLAEQIRGEGAVLNNAINDVQSAAQTVSLQQTQALVSNPGALVAPSAPLEIATAPTGGDVAVNDNRPAENNVARITGGESVTLSQQQAQGAQAPQSADERLALALAQAAKMERNEEMLVLRT